MTKVVEPIFWRFGWFVKERPDMYICVFDGNDRWKRVHGRLYFRFEDK